MFLIIIIAKKNSLHTYNWSFLKNGAHTRVICKDPKRGRKLWGWSFFKKTFYFRACSLIEHWSLFWKLVEVFEAFSFHISKFERILRSNQGMRMRPTILTSQFNLHKLVWPTHSSSKPSFISWHHLFCMII